MTSAKHRKTTKKDSRNTSKVDVSSQTENKMKASFVSVTRRLLTRKGKSSSGSNSDFHLVQQVTTTSNNDDTLKGRKFTVSSGRAKGGCVGQVAYRRKIADQELSEDIVRKTTEAFSKEVDGKKREPK